MKMRSFFLASCDSFWADNKCNVIPFVVIGATKNYVADTHTHTHTYKKKREKINVLLLQQQRMQRQIFVNAPFEHKSFDCLQGMGQCKGH